MLRHLVLAVPLLAAGCGGELGGAPLVSAQTPPGTGAVNGASEPQSLNSLPPGAAGRPHRGPFATWPNFASYTFDL